MTDSEANASGRRQMDSAAPLSGGTKAELLREIEDLPEEHAETVLHHVRLLKQTPTDPSAAAAPSGGMGDLPEKEREDKSLVWACGRCGNEMEREAQAPPSGCANCGAPREELALREKAL